MARSTLGLALGLALGVSSANGSIYPIKNELVSHTAESFIKDTPMFALADSPYWLGSTQDPYIKVKGSVSSAADVPKGSPLIRIIHAWAKEAPNLGELNDLEHFYLCSSDGPNKEDFDGFDKQLILSEGGTKTTFSTSFNITETAWHVTIVTNCLDSDVDFDGEFHYMNPYGYLNGWAFGIMPLNLFLFVAYGLLGVVYVYKTVRYREHVLRLQYAIIAVVLMGFVERMTWFLTYVEMNTSGGRACCPVRGDLTFSLGLSVFKRSSGALLLLAVCIGYGVVKPTLSKSEVLRIIVLGVIYTFSSLNLEISKVEDISSNGRQTNPQYFSSLLVSACDVIILFWIYYSLMSNLTELQKAGQKSKLAMYQSLARSLGSWIIVWFFFTLLEIMLYQEKLNVGWRYWFLIVSFWDLFFFGILSQICYIWLPSELTSQYAFSQQLPTTEDLDEFDQVGLEMHAPESANEFVIGVDDDDDDDDDDEISFDGTDTAAPDRRNGTPKTSKVSMA